MKSVGGPHAARGPDSTAICNLRLYDKIHLNSADVVLVIPMIPSPFFPVPFIHFMAWPGST